MPQPRLWHGDITSPFPDGYVCNLDVPYLSVTVGGPDTEDNVCVRHPQTGNDRNQKDTDETVSWKRRDRLWFALLEFALLVEVPRGNRWWEGLRWSHRYANREQNKDEWLCGDQHSSHPLGSEEKI